MPHEPLEGIRATPFTTDDIDRRPVYASDRSGSPIATILAMKDEDATRDAAIHRAIGGPSGDADAEHRRT
jgi:hypothetical protein